MHAYIRTESDVWAVGYYIDEGREWVPVRDFSEEMFAAAYVNYLNGGDGNIETAARLIVAR